MGENSAISWCDCTFNPWLGCTEVSPACDRCYARTLMQDRYGRVVWGAGQHRVRTKTWGDPVKWNRQAGITGKRPRVFCASLADVFDNEVPDDWRADLWRLMEATPNLRWIPLTKRIGNVAWMVPLKWLDGGWPPHVGIMATLVNQEEWDRDFRKLVEVPAPWRGVSAEPLLGRIDCRGFGAVVNGGEPRINWMITGGESGQGFRHLDMDAVRDIRDQCAFWGVTFHHKQNGGIHGKDAGCLLDGIEHKNFPPALAA